MITLLPDFEEKERKYWKYIEDYLRYPDIIKTYKPLKLIRLKNFIENQMASRKSQIILYLGELSQKEALSSFQKDIKSRLGEIQLNKQHTIYKNYLNDPEIEIIENEINYLLRVTDQYCCNYFTLENIHKSISEILNNNYFEEKNIIPKQTPEEASSETDIVKKYNLKINTEILQIVIDNLKEYFDPNEHSKLQELFEGKNITKKLTFKGNKNQLTELFKRIEYNNHIISSYNKTDIANWLVNNFTTEKGDFSFEQVYKEELCKTEFSIQKNKRICTSIAYKTEKDLKQLNIDNRK